MPARLSNRDRSHVFSSTPDIHIPKDYCGQFQNKAGNIIFVDGIAKLNTRVSNYKHYSELKTLILKSLTPEEQEAELIITSLTILEET